MEHSEVETERKNWGSGLKEDRKWGTKRGRGKT
jgi:hypothetical protein